MVNANADQASVEHTASIRVRLNVLSFYLLGSIPSKLRYYLLGLLVLATVIGGIFFYIYKVKSQMKSYPALVDPIEPITGSDPVPAREDNFGLARRQGTANGGQ